MKQPRKERKRIVKAGSFRQIRAKYNIHPKFLGSGSYGKVFLANNIANPDVKMAIKTLSKKKLSEEAINGIKDEILILQSLDHPNIIKYFETFENDTYMYLVMEHGEGCELFERLTDEKVKFTEQEAAKIMKKLFHAINHCHANGIAHRDLKPENIMYKSTNIDEDTEIGIIDFGLSKQNANSKTKMKTTCGTPYYVAPEVLDASGYGTECDIWSLGVIMYILLSGYLPFHGNSLAEIYDNIMEKDPSFDTDPWKIISKEAISLVRKGLDRNRKTRITAANALESDWFEVVEKKKPNPLSNEVYESLKSYQANSILKKEAMNILVKMLKNEELEELREEFRNIDKDYTGEISASELEEAIRNMGKNITANEIRQIIANVDYLENGKINYSEFLSATISAKNVITSEMLWALFKHFDTDDSGYITPENIQDSLGKTGKEISREELDRILEEHDIKKDGKICFDEFKLMMGNLKVEEINKMNTADE